MQKKMRSPIWWVGGKGNMVEKLLKLLPPRRMYEIYVEPFGGGASLLFAKEPHGNEVYNDINSGLVNLFRVIRDESKFKEFYRRVCLTPYSREEYYYCANTWEECEDEVEKAYRFFIVVRQSFGGIISSGWGFTVNALGRGISRAVSGYLSIIELLPEIHQRIMRVQIENKDFREIFKTYDTEKTLFYVDPPYILDTRGSKDLYEHELQNKDHEDLVNILLNIKGLAMLSGYKHEIYKPLEDAGWRRYDFKTVSHAAGRTRYTKIHGKGAAKERAKRVESVWINYDLPKQEELF